MLVVMLAVVTLGNSACHDDCVAIVAVVFMVALSCSAVEIVVMASVAVDLQA